jgi:transposase
MPTPKRRNSTDEISRHVAKGAHCRAAARLRRMAHHRQARRAKNFALIFLPSRAPELNPVENIWQYLRQLALQPSLRNIDAIIDAACEAWRKLVAKPETITSTGMRDWAHVGQT